MEATGRLETNNNNYQYKGLKDLADRIISITQAATKSKALKGCCSQEAKLPNVNLTIDLRFVLEGSKYNFINHKNYNSLNCDWFKKLLFPTNSLAKLLSDSLLSDSLLSDSLLSDSLLLDSSTNQSHSKL